MLWYLFNEMGNVGSVGFQAVWDVQHTGSICDAIIFERTHSCPQTINTIIKERVFGMCTPTENFPTRFSLRHSQLSLLLESILVPNSILLPSH
jgi:hypothetical protein